ncbi:3-oxoacyl-ACP synthase III family protein [Micromonospora sp. NPDC049275]|uniref:3-oxoacyl-ACP synthase III family protein n=1 Tax=Micromonospora sp. NPDC049275 TaxID=3364268 RepID=UPI003714CDDC
MTAAIGILGTGAYLPKQEVDNDEVAAMVPDVTPERIEHKTQIRSRRYAAPDEATSDLAAAAARLALADAGLAAEDVDYILLATSTGDSPQPPTSCRLQSLVGARRAACVDVNAVCAGFVYALGMARALLALQPGSTALVVGADIYSRILDYRDRSTAILFGDGAGAVVLGAVPAGRGIIDIGLASRGEAMDLIRVEAGGSRIPPSVESVESGGHYFRMQGRGVSEFVMANVPPMIAALLERNGATLADIRHFVPHQANGVLLTELVSRCGLDGARTHRTLAEYGNIGGASVPVALDAAARSGTLNDGDLVLLAGFGGGMSMGAGLLRWSAPVLEASR